MSNQFPSRQQFVLSNRGYSESVKGPWRSGTGIAPSFCQFRFIARGSRRRTTAIASGACSSYTVLQNHERNCSLMSAGVKEWKDVILKTVPTPYPTTK